MPERFTTNCTSVASGTDKALINLFNPAAAPTSRGGIYEIDVGSVATPADQAAHFNVHRTTAVGTEGSGLVPANIDPGGPAGAYDSGIGAFSVQPTETAAKIMLSFPLNQRATYRWVAAPECEIWMAATQNNGCDLKTLSSTSTQTHCATLFFVE